MCRIGIECLVSGRQRRDAFCLAFEDDRGDVLGHVFCDGDDAAVTNGAVWTEEHLTKNMVNLLSIPYS